MRFDRRTRRRIVDYLMRYLALGCVIVALVPLGAILYQSGVLGAQAFRPGFLTENPPPPCSASSISACPSGGIGNAIFGTGVLVGLAAGISVPIGILAGIYLSEFARGTPGRTVRFFTDVLTGVPSIVVGISVYSLFLLAAHDGWISLSWVLSAFSGAVALSIIMVPIVTRTTEEALKLVPVSLREAGLALGIPRYRTVSRIVLSTGRAGIVTGALLAVARAGGEAAPLIMTAFGNIFSFQGLNHPVAALPLVIYYYGLSGIPNYVAIAWGSALVLVAIMLGISVLARWALRSRFGSVMTGG